MAPGRPAGTSRWQTPGHSGISGGRPRQLRLVNSETGLAAPAEGRAAEEIGGAWMILDCDWASSIRRIRSASAASSASLGDSAIVAVSTNVKMLTPTISGSRNDSPPGPFMLIVLPGTGAY